MADRLNEVYGWLNDPETVSIEVPKKLWEAYLEVCPQQEDPLKPLHRWVYVYVCQKLKVEIMPPEL